MQKKYKITLFFALFSFCSIIAQVPRARTDYDTADINTTLNVPAPGVLENDTEWGTWIGDRIDESKQLEAKTDPDAGINSVTRSALHSMIQLTDG